MSVTPDRLRSVVAAREAVLRAVAAGPVTKRALTEALAVSRSTVDRALSDLEDVGCVTDTPDGHVATTTGRVALGAYDRYARRTEAIVDSLAFLDRLPDDVTVDPVLLDGATITLADERRPDSPLQPALDLFDRATSLHGLAPAILSFYPDLILSRVRAADIDVDIVAERAVLDVLSDLPGDEAAALLAHENVSFSEAAGDLPYALWIMGTDDGDVAGITTYDAGGADGVLQNGDPAAVEWAWETFEGYRNAATPVEELPPE